VLGSVSLAIVVLPEEVTSPSTLSAGYAGLMTALAFAAGIGVQPAARRLAGRRPTAGVSAGLAAAAAGAAVAVAAVSVAGGTGAGGALTWVLAGLAAVLLGLAYGLCLVSGLYQAEELSGPDDRGSVLAGYYVLAYLGFTAPYAMDGLNAVLGRPGAFALLAGLAAVLAAAMRPRGAGLIGRREPGLTGRRDAGLTGRRDAGVTGRPGPDPIRPAGGAEGAPAWTAAPQKRRIASNYEIPDPRADLLHHQRLLD
jgi:hypothetical protein